MSENINGDIDLWVIAVDFGTTVAPLATLVELAGVDPSRFVFVTTYPLEIPTYPIKSIIIPDAKNEAQLWNAGLRHVYAQYPEDDPVDILLLFGGYVTPRDSADILRTHMRTLDVMMAEPDLADQLDGNDYGVRFSSEEGDFSPPTVVMCGESRTLFDERFHRGDVAWVEFCHRNRAIGGTVLVSTDVSKES